MRIRVFILLFFLVGVVCMGLIGMFVLVGDFQPVTPGVEPVNDTGPSSLASPFDSRLLAMVLFVGAALVAIRVWFREPGEPKFKFKRRSDTRSRAEIHEKRLAVEAMTRPRMTDFVARGQPAPLMHEVFTYIDGYQRFNKSVPIELLSGEFLGEFGVGIAASSVYARDKAAALDVWLFDKADTKTATAVLASDQILTDPARQAELQAKGAVLKAQPGGVMTLITHTLRVRAKVLDFAYGRAPNLPAESFFDYVVLEIVIWQK